VSPHTRRAEPGHGEKTLYVAAPEGGGIAIYDYASGRSIGTIERGLGQYTEGVALSPVAQL
jgi:hypothetical protein